MSKEVFLNIGSIYISSKTISFNDANQMVHLLQSGKSFNYRVNFDEKSCISITYNSPLEYVLEIQPRHGNLMNIELEFYRYSYKDYAPSLFAFFEGVIDIMSAQGVYTLKY